MKDIRKISVGRDYPNGAMHYQKGKEINLAGSPYKITDIVVDENLKAMGIITYNIYIANSNGKVLWKQITDVPVIIENNIDFD